MQLWISEHFFLHKKVPVVLYRYLPFCEEKSVQPFRVALFRSDFLQNSYFRHYKDEIWLSGKFIHELPVVPMFLPTKVFWKIVFIVFSYEK